MFPENKPRPGMGAFYIGMYPELAEIALKHGYALAVHGSLRRDFDLFAIPWVPNPSPPRTFLEEITSTFSMYIGGEPHVYCGRERWALIFTYGEAFIDIQFVAVITNAKQMEDRIKFLEIELAKYKPEAPLSKKEINEEIEKYIENLNRVDEF